ncbi:MAG: type II toxin-antitoxin system RelE/ParE family toxin [Defluviitaleaceae bacterium]|nr:type II toxin-antitoxin system RelE/ParE family toxin [Defluviitaleaceae bacterium]
MGNGEFMRVVVLESAYSDIKIIREILKEYGKMPTVNFRKTLSQFRKHVSKMPLMYPEYEYNSAFRAAVLVYDYVAFYKVDENNDTVNVFRILHCNRNISEILKPT